MCLGIPGRIVAVTDEAIGMAIATVSDVERRVNIALVQADGIAPGDWVMVHAGFALSKLDEREALETLQILQEIGDAYADEMGAGQPAPPMQ